MAVYLIDRPYLAPTCFGTESPSLTDKLINLPSHFSDFNKELFYYSQQVQEYSDLLNGSRLKRMEIYF